MTTEQTRRARHLRQADNPAERTLWSALKSSQLGDFKFTRQFPIGPYFADFACCAHNVVIELDGSQHVAQNAYDRARDEYMINAGYAVFRVPAVSVLRDCSVVCDSILAVLEGRMEEEADGFDVHYQRSSAAPVRRGFSSRHAQRRGF